MSKVPFKRFVLTFLLFGKGIPYIVEKLESFGYHITDPEVSAIFDDLTDTLPTALTATINSGERLDLGNESHVQWLHHYGVYEFYDYIWNKNTVKGSTEDRPYFKWCADCLWVHGHKDVMSLINIFLYNNEDLESISQIVMFKYRKKVGVDALQLYRNMFWDTEDLSAKDSYYYCTTFRDNALIVRKLRSGQTEIEFPKTEGNDGSDVPFTFHDSDYIKWKIGYRDFTVPGPSDFMRRVQEDSYFKYYEAMSMTQSIETEEEMGTNDKLGNFDSTRTKRRNVEEQRAKMVKHWLDVYLKAHTAIPTGGTEDDDFFDKMDQLELGYDEYSDEKIMAIDENRQILDEIAQDMNPVGGEDPPE